MSSGNSQQDPSGRVLVVDDEALVRGVLVDILPEFGFEVVGAATDGLEALELTRELEPDIVLLDIEMPRLDGIRCAERLREEHPGVPVVIFSARDEEVLRQRAADAGAVAFLVKGCPLAEVAAALSAALAGRS